MHKGPPLRIKWPFTLHDYWSALLKTNSNVQSSLNGGLRTFLIRLVNLHSGTSSCCSDLQFVVLDIHTLSIEMLICFFVFFFSLCIWGILHCVVYCKNSSWNGLGMYSNSRYNSPVSYTALHFLSTMSQGDNAMCLSQKKISHYWFMVFVSVIRFIWQTAF